jgi:hypothetical protein
MANYLVTVEIQDPTTGKPTIPPSIVRYKVTTEDEVEPIESAGELGRQAAKDDGYVPVGVAKVELDTEPF